MPVITSKMMLLAVSIAILFTVIVFCVCLACYPLTWFYPLPLIHCLLREYFTYFQQTCDELNIQYWADSGTLLGCIRDGGLIAHDDDGDVCMLGDALQTLRTALNSNPDSEYQIVDMWGVYKFVHKCIPNICIDIFEVEETEDGLVIQYADKRHRTKWPAFYHLKEDLYPLQSLPFERSTILVPRNPLPYLARAYGDWKTPVKWIRHPFMY